MIDIKKLRKTKDIGKWVEYIPTDGHKEIGRLKSWNDKYIFVVYHCGNEWMRFRHYTGAATSPEDLFFIERKDLCSHCNTPIVIRNAKGICDHLYYPESCEFCKGIVRTLPRR